MNPRAAPSVSPITAGWRTVASDLRVLESCALIARNCEFADTVRLSGWTRIPNDGTEQESTAGAGTISRPATASTGSSGRASEEARRSNESPAELPCGSDRSGWTAIRDRKCTHARTVSGLNDVSTWPAEESRESEHPEATREYRDPYCLPFNLNSLAEVSSVGLGCGLPMRQKHGRCAPTMRVRPDALWVPYRERDGPHRELRWS